MSNGTVIEVLSVTPVVGFIVSALLTGPVSSQGCAFDSTASWTQVNRAWSAGDHGRWENDSLRRVLLALERDDQERS